MLRGKFQKYVEEHH